MVVPRRSLRFRLPFRVMALLLLGGAGIAEPGFGAQSTLPTEGAGWNALSALDLVERGRLARTRLVQDGGLERYEAEVEGHVYFFLDGEAGAPLLLRVDQVAVELRWEAHDIVQQRIVGERSETRLPVQDFRYYTDRVTLVEYGLGDEIRIGQGRDVAGVPHPLAAVPGGPNGVSPYDFRLSDSLSLSLPGRDEPLQVYEIEVRPRDPTQPGMVGTLTLDGGSGSLIRIAAAFTPASYVDPRTDRISVALDYGLWEDRYWLPNEQVIEVRREIPQVDLGVGTVIRSVLRTGGYRLNLPPTEDIGLLPPITQLPATERRNYPFAEGLYDGLERDGVAGIRMETDLRALRAEAIGLAGTRIPSGLSPLRFYLASVSSIVRYRRTEGLHLGGGFTYRPTPVLRVRGSLGVATGAGRVGGHLSVEGTPAPGWTLGAAAHRFTPRDLGLAPGTDPILSSLRAVSRGEDYLDPYLASGGELSLTFLSDSSTAVSVSAGFERIRTPKLVREMAPVGSDHPVRPVRPVEAGEFVTGSLRFDRSLVPPGGSAGWTRVGLAFLSGPPGRGTALEAEGAFRWGPRVGERELLLTLDAWHWEGDPLPQGHRLFGGRNTLPGYGFRSFLGQTAVAGSLMGATDLGTPLLRLRGGLYAGWGDRVDPAVAVAWEAAGTDGVRGAASLGVGIGWDILRIDLARGFSGGEWQLLLSIDPRWWDRL